jgi:hypothetical protein
MHHLPVLFFSESFLFCYSFQSSPFQCLILFLDLDFHPHLVPTISFLSLLHFLGCLTSPFLFTVLSLLDIMQHVCCTCAFIFAPRFHIHGLKHHPAPSTSISFGIFPSTVSSTQSTILHLLFSLLSLIYPTSLATSVAHVLFFPLPFQAVSIFPTSCHIFIAHVLFFSLPISSFSISNPVLAVHCSVLHLFFSLLSPLHSTSCDVSMKHVLFFSQTFHPRS